MASKVIKGLTVEIGGDTTKLGKALDKVETKTHDLSRELGEVNKLLRMDPGNTELLAQKQQILAEAVETTKEKLDTLKEAERQVQEQFARGEVSAEQVRALQREIAATEQKLQGYERAADETADKVRRLGNGADDAAREIDNMAESVEDAEDASEDLGSALDGTLADGFNVVTALATAASAAIVGCSEASHEYRTAMGKLDTAFATNGHSAETAYNTYAALHGILGETDQAVEASNHLAVMVHNEEDLAKWTKIATGAYAVFGDSLPVEGLTEAANETAKVGRVTGPLADALNWAAKEGDNFGLTLKENNGFTEKSAKALKKMTKKQREEYETRKKQHKEIEEYNQRIMDAVSAEDKFNIALEECTTEQERQELITKTLSKAYDKAADSYRDTNKEIIEANEANEEWNKTVAEIGETMAPVVTDVKKFGTEILKSVSDPLEDVAMFIRGTVLPALTGITTWIRNNIPTVNGALVGMTAALVAFKVAAIATEVAQKGLKGAILATAAAEKVLQAVQAASPWGLVAVAVTALTTALIAYAAATEEAQKPVDVLTEKERELMAAADETAASFRDQKKATEEALADVGAEMGNAQKLADELMTLADASGKVKEKDQERVNFILGELNNALGTEYSMVDGVIQKYDELTGSINDVIQAKLANSLLEAANEAYVEAIRNEATAMENANLKYKDYQNQLQVTEEKEAAYLKAKEAWHLAMEEGNHYNIEGTQQMMAIAEEAYNKEKDILDQKKTDWEQSAADYKVYQDTIGEYQKAQEAALAGNYDTTVDLLTKKGEAYGTYSENVDAETAKVLDTLYKEAIDAGLHAEQIKKNFEDGVEGFTEEMVKEAEEGYEEALSEFENAYADAENFGEDLAEGMIDGAENKRTSLLSKARSLVSGFLAAARKEADSHSPSRKMIAFGEDLGEGTEIGLENKTKDLLATAKRQVNSLMGAYSDAGDKVSQTAFQNVSRSSTQRESQTFTALAGNADKLDKILAAIERGQVLTIDGKQLVGQTAAMYDNELGRRRALAARGAL